MLLLLALPALATMPDLTLEVGRETITGRLSDNCSEFDLVGAAPVDVSERADERLRRGYGVTLIQRALDHVAHEFGPQGNTITFQKRILSCPVN